MHETINTPETMALAKVITKKVTDAARNEMEAGVYTVDFTVRITGSLDIGEDYERTPTVKLSPLLLAALAIKGRGATQLAFENKLAEMMRESCTAEPTDEQVEVAEAHAFTEGLKDLLGEAVTAANNGEGEALAQKVSDEMKTVKKQLASLPKTTVRGSVKPSLVVARVMPELTTGKLRKAVISKPKQQELV